MAQRMIVAFNCAYSHCRVLTRFRTTLPQCTSCLSCSFRLCDLGCSTHVGLLALSFAHTGRNLVYSLVTMHFAVPFEVILLCATAAHLRSL